MPAKTTQKKASPEKKSTAKKPAARAAAPAKSGPPKNGATNGAAKNGAGSLQASSPEQAAAAEQGAAAQAREAALRQESDRHRLAVREKEDLLRDLQARLTTRQAELEAARAESANLRDAVNKLRGPGEKGNLRCPRCAGHMTEYAHEDIVKADRCDACHALFLDNGELELIIQHHDKQRDAGRKHWYSSLFGGRK